MGVDYLSVGMLTILWYPFLSYCFTVVSFYDNRMTILRPLFPFYSKSIMYEKIDLMRLTNERPAMIIIYFRDENKTCTFYPPLSKKRDRKMLEVLEAKGVEYQN